MSIVVKFGGSVFRSEEGYRQVACELERLSEEFDKVYAVVSARQGETERLINQTSRTLNLNGNTPDLRKALEGCLSPEAAYEFDTVAVSRMLIQGEIDSVDRLVELLPAGMAEGMRQTEPGYPVIARGSYLCGHVLLPESVNAAQHNLKKQREERRPITVVSGFGGVDLQGNVVLLGRNASDYVAAVCAYLFDAQQLVFYKDVDGIYLHFGQPSQQKLDVLTREQFLQMGRLKVLDQRVVDIYGGDIKVTSLAQNQQRGAGTLIPCAK